MSYNVFSGRCTSLTSLLPLGRKQEWCLSRELHFHGTFYSSQCSFCTAKRLYLTAPSPSHHSGVQLPAQLTKLSQEVPSYLRRLWWKMSLYQDFCKCVNLRRTNIQLVFDRTDRTSWFVSESHPLPPRFFQIFCIGYIDTAIAQGWHHWKMNHGRGVGVCFQSLRLVSSCIMVWLMQGSWQKSSSGPSRKEKNMFVIFTAVSNLVRLSMPANRKP